MAAEAVDCISAGASRMTIDLAVLGEMYAMANNNNGHGHSVPQNGNGTVEETAASHRRHKASA
jgi:hypothetical protein